MLERHQRFEEMNQSDDGTFVWCHARTREMFQKYHLWPSFIGSRNDPYSDASGLLPMMLWEEQARFLAQEKLLEGVAGVAGVAGIGTGVGVGEGVTPTGSTGSTGSKKRKLSAVESEESQSPDSQSSAYLRPYLRKFVRRLFPGYKTNLQPEVPEVSADEINALVDTTEKNHSKQQVYTM